MSQSPSGLPERRLPRPAAVALGLAIGAGALAVLATSAASVIAVLMARKVITPPLEREQDERILGATSATVALSPSRDAVTPGRYGLWFSDDAGYARVGEILTRTPRSVTRAVLSVERGDLSTATRGRLSSWFYLDPRELDLPVEDVVIDTPIGPAPAWLVRPEADAAREGWWAIQVHGRAVLRQETIRALPVFRDAGFTSLSVSYRNDGEAPRSIDGRYALGDAEWRDIDAAMRYAVDHGAQHIVLMGFSMGGAIVLQAATRSALGDLVRGVVLDSPVIDWRNVLDAQGRSAGIPRPVRHGAMDLIGNSWAGRVTGLDEPVDFARLDFVRRAADLVGPILLLASTGDDYVPAGPAIALAEARPDIVDLELFEGARHVRLWNYDAPRWNAAIERFLAGLD